MTHSIEGFDLTPYIAFGGLKWGFNAVDGPNAGRLENGDMERDMKTVKLRFDITCRPLTSTEVTAIVSRIKGSEYNLTYTDPQDNTVKTNPFYSNNFSATYLVRRANGEDLWNLSFPQIQI